MTNQTVDGPHWL